MKQKVFKQRLGAKRLLFTILFSCFLLALTFQTQPIDGSSSSHPQAVLSLSGTLGDNGWYTSDVEASLYTTGGDESDSLVAEYALYNQAWAAFEEPFTIFQEGQTTIYYRVRNEDTDYLGETKFSMVDIDKTPPSGSIIIDGGSKGTYSKAVTLTSSVMDEPSGPTTNPPSGYIWGVPSGPSDIRFSNDGHVWSSWEPIVKEKSWLLESGGGTKTVYVQVRDNAGLVSEAFSDTINLLTTKDNTAPTTKIAVSGKQNPQGTYTSAVAITLNSVDDLSGVSLTEYSFDNYTWTNYTRPLPITAEGSHIMYFRSQDAAGNVEFPVQSIIEIKLGDEKEPVSSIALFAIVGSFSLGICGVLLIKRKAFFPNRKNRG